MCENKRTKQKTGRRDICILGAGMHTAVWIVLSGEPETRSSNQDFVVRIISLADGGFTTIRAVECVAPFSLISYCKVCLGWEEVREEGVKVYVFRVAGHSLCLDIAGG
jgi:hypothetical protein